MVLGLIGLLLAAVGAWLAGYAHARLAAHTATRLQAELVRLVLIAVGVATGLLVLRWRQAVPTSVLGDVLAFIAAFGFVHLPAAFILWSKRQRGVYR